MNKNFILIVLVIIFGGACFYLGSTFDFSKSNQEGYYVQQGYSFKIPQGWTETDELGTTAFLNEAEDNGENSFKSYLFFVKDNLLGRTPEQYFEYIKSNIKENSESSEVLEEKDDGDFHVLYLKTAQGGVNYVVAMAFLPGIDDSFSIISLNTLEDKLESTKSIFEETYRTFKLR